MVCAGIDAPCLEMKDSVCSQIVAWMLWMVIFAISTLCRFLSWLIFGSPASVRKEANPAQRIFNFALLMFVFGAMAISYIMLLVSIYQHQKAMESRPGYAKIQRVKK